MKMQSFKIFTVVTIAFTTISSWLYALDYRNIDQENRPVITGRNMTQGTNAVVKTIAERKSVPFYHTVNVNVALIAENVGEDYNSRSCIALDSDGWLGVRNIEILYYWAGLLEYKISREIKKYDLMTGFILEEKVTVDACDNEGMVVFIVEYKYDDYDNIDEITADLYNQENELLTTYTIPGDLIYDYYSGPNIKGGLETFLKNRLRAGSIKTHTNPILLGTFSEDTWGSSIIVIRGNVTNLDSEGKPTLYSVGKPFPYGGMPYSLSSASFRTTIEANN